MGRRLRHGLRVMMRSPGTSVAALLTFAIGIGANTALFSVIYAVLLRPLPFPESERLVLLWNEYQGKPSFNSPPDYNDRVEQSRTLESVAALVLRDANLTGRGEPVHIQGAAVTASFFPTLGVKPVMGRVFLPEEDVPGKDRLVVLGHGCWKRAFGGDPGILGSSIDLNGVPHEVIGVMPASFDLPIAAVDAWRPMALTAASLGDDSRGNEYLWVIGRRAATASHAQVEAEMDVIAANVIRNVPERAEFLTRNDWGARAVPLREEFVGQVRPALGLLLGAVGLVLLIACANVANLLLARGSSRMREFAVRSALGAGARQLVLQSLTETSVLALLGGAGGLLLAPWLQQLLVSTAPVTLPFLGSAALSLPVLLFASCLSVGVGFLAGLLPALQALKGRDLVALYAGAGRSSSRGGVRQAIVVAEVAISCILLAGAVLLLQSFERLLRVDPGFGTENRLVARLSLPPVRYPDAASRIQFVRELSARLRSLPGVRGVGAAHNLPLTGANHTASLGIEGRDSSPGQESPGGIYRSVTPGFFQAMGIPLLRGRLFEDRDDPDGPAAVVIVDETAAERFWPGEDPIGKRLEFDQWREVVGVVGGIRSRGLDAPLQESIYVPYAQYATRELSFVTQTAGDPRGIVGAERATVRQIDPSLPIYGTTTIEDQMRGSIADRAYPMMLLSAFAAAALLLVAIGIYGVIGFSVGQRTREIGTRVALGATPRNVLGGVLREGMRISGAGLAVGLLGALLLSRLLSSLLYGVGVLDPATYVVTAVLVLAVSLLAAFLPARRATRVSPIEALREE